MFLPPNIFRVINVPFVTCLNMKAVLKSVVNVLLHFQNLYSHMKFFFFLWLGSFNTCTVCYRWCPLRKKAKKLAEITRIYFAEISQKHTYDPWRPTNNKCQSIISVLSIVNTAVGGTVIARKAHLQRQLDQAAVRFSVMAHREFLGFHQISHQLLTSTTTSAAKASVVCMHLLSPLKLPMYH